MDDEICPIWQTPITNFKRQGDRCSVISSRAGGCFDISGSAVAMLNEEISGWKKVAITEQIFLANISNQEIYIDSTFLSNLKYPKKLKFGKMFDRFFVALANQNPELGHVFSSREIPVSDTGRFMAAAINSPSSSTSGSAAAIQLLVETAVKRRFLEQSDGNAPGDPVQITALGWEHIELLGVSISLSDQIFVAMWFGSDEQTRLYVDGIKPAIEGAGYNAIRIDDTEHNNKIDDQIIAEIRKSAAVVVDMTCGLAKPLEQWSESEVVGSPRGGVFFEAGFAAGLGLPVIWSVKSSLANLENVVHFDVRQYNQIRWSDDFSEFSKRLQYRIEATLGRGNAKVQ
jgi:hypothetical protein